MYFSSTNSEIGICSTDLCSVFHGRKNKEVTHRFTCHLFNAFKYDVHALILYPFQSPYLLITEGQDCQGIFNHQKNQALVQIKVAWLTVYSAITLIAAMPFLVLIITWSTHSVKTRP